MGASINLKAPAESLGLTSAEAAKRLATNGANVLTPPVKKGAWRKYFDSLTSLFNLLLILCGVLEYGASHRETGWWDGMSRRFPGVALTAHSTM